MALSEALYERLDELTDEVMRRVHAQLPPWMTQPELLQESRRFTRASLAAELEALDARSLPDACPEVDAQGARLGARAGAPLDALLRGYRTGNAVLWEAAFDHLGDAGAVREATAFFFAYADRLSAFVTAEHTAERERVLRTAEQRRTHLVRELLDGAEVDSEALGYDLAGPHVGVVAWGPRAQEAVAALAGGPQPVLAVALLEATTWAWLGGDDGLPEPPAGTRLALGEPATGAEGFRRTHRQALHAQRAGEAAGAPVTRFADVALEALALADEAEARAFVARELAGLDGDDLVSERLRATLEAYFRAGHNAAAAGAALGVHEQTVANRLRAVEQRTGHQPLRRRAELETALRVRRLL